MASAERSDSLRLYNRALSSQEVAQLYALGLRAAADRAESSVKLDELSGARLDVLRARVLYASALAAAGNRESALKALERSDKKREPRLKTVRVNLQVSRNMVRHFLSGLGAPYPPP